MATSVATPYRRTALTLERFRKLVMPGVNPLHYWGFRGNQYFPDRNCDQVVAETTFFTGNVGRQEMADAIEDAEDSLTDLLGYHPAPEWVADESYTWPKYHYRRFTNAIAADGRRTPIQLFRGEVIAPGRRAVSVIATGVAVTYSDADGDGFDETATITSSGVTVTDKREIRVFHPGVSADERWEIRDIDSMTLVSGTLTIKLKSWLLANPDVRVSFPGTSEWVGADPDTGANFISTVDLYRVYNDPTQVAARLYWEPRPAGEIGTDESALTTQDGTFSVRHPQSAIVVPMPATYSAGWATQPPSVGRSPDRVALWYYSGYQSSEFKRELAHDPLDDRLAQAIAYLAAARLSGKLCDCCDALVGQLQQNLAVSTEAGNFVLLPEFINKGTGLGPRVGEWYAWNKISNMPKHHVVAVL